MLAVSFLFCIFVAPKIEKKGGIINLKILNNDKRRIDAQSH
jgi:hypothetical protein